MSHNMPANLYLTVSCAEPRNIYLVIISTSFVDRAQEGTVSQDSVLRRSILTISSLIAIMLSRFRMNVEDCRKEYEDLSHRIFGKPRWCSQRNVGVVPWSKYSAKAMEKVFKDVTSRRCESSAWTRHHFNAPTLPTTPNTCAMFVLPFFNPIFHLSLYRTIQDQSAY
jgi:hypothetical protein